MSAYDNDYPRCECGPLINRVTNLPDGQPWSNDIAHASSWVCEKRACVLDAMAWVERFTNIPAYVYGPLSGLGATA